MKTWEIANALDVSYTELYNNIIWPLKSARIVYPLNPNPGPKSYEWDDKAARCFKRALDHKRYGLSNTDARQKAVYEVYPEYRGKLMRWEEYEQLRKKSIEGWSVRKLLGKNYKTSLKGHGIKTVGDLTKCSENELLEIWGLNEERVIEIKTRLKEYGLYLAGDPEYIEHNSLEGLGLSSHIVGTLKDAGIRSVRDLNQYSKPELLGIWGLSRKNVKEIETGMEKRGLSLYRDPISLQTIGLSQSEIGILRWEYRVITTEDLTYLSEAELSLNFDKGAIERMKRKLESYGLSLSKFPKAVPKMA